MRKKKIILIGGGGHCKACIDVIEHTGQYHIEGILDSHDLVGTSVLGYKIIGTDQDILKYKEEDCCFLVTVGQIKSATVRKKIFSLLKKDGAVLATIISPGAHVSEHAEIGEGTIIMHGAIDNAAAKIGDNCILNTGCIVEHDAVLGNHTHLSTSAVINGGSIIGSEVFIGSNSTLSGQINVIDHTIIGSGSVVIRSIEEAGTYVGNPVKRINK